MLAMPKLSLALLATSTLLGLGARERTPPTMALGPVAAASPACGSPYDHVDVVRAYDTDEYRLCFGRGSASVRVEGDHSSDLDCYVYGPAGSLVAKDDDHTDYCILDWRAFRGDHRLVIRNLGDANLYRVTSN